MFWGDTLADKIESRFAARVRAKEPLIIRDEKTASGRVHVGSMRGVAIHGLVSDILTERGVSNTFLYEINDFDPMDGLPVYLDEKTFGPHMGEQLYKIPSPDPSAQNFAEYFGGEFSRVIQGTGFSPTLYRASELYLSGRMDEVIRLALERADRIRDIYKRVSGAERPAGWLPLSVVCEKCGKIGTTRAYDFDGETVAYMCEPDAVSWARGCGHKGRVSPFRGNAKLPWKVEWPAKFKVVGVHIEGAGKDHSTKGGARDVADHISKE
ncbi:MAG TPA: lysine--tRNA ligase, partial [Candidatus Paceibacterota bacterium]